MRAASRTKVFSRVANNSRVDRTSPVSKVVSKADFKIKGPANAGPFLMRGFTIRPIRRLPLPH